MQAVALIPQFLFFFANGESGRSAFHHQRSDSFFTFGRFRIYVDDGRIGRAAICNPRFCAVQNIFVVALAVNCFGLQCGGV